MARRRAKNRKTVGKNYHLSKRRVSSYPKRKKRLSDLTVRRHLDAKKINEDHRRKAVDWRRRKRITRKIGRLLAMRKIGGLHESRSVSRRRSGRFDNISDGKTKKDWERRVCSQRSVRQQALFALGRIGKGVKLKKEKRFSEKSKVRC